MSICTAKKYESALEALSKVNNIYIHTVKFSVPKKNKNFETL